MAAGAGTYNIRLEAVRKLGGELLLGLLKTRAEGCPLDPDDLGDSFVCQTFLTELADSLCLRHQLVKALEQHLQFGLVTDDLFNGRGGVSQIVER